MARRFFPDPKDYPQDNAQRAYGSREWDDMSKNGLKRAYGSKSWDDNLNARGWPEKHTYWGQPHASGGLFGKKL